MNGFNLDIAIEGIDRLLRLCKSEVKEKKETEKIRRGEVMI
jgi:chemotaxis response regulator CheB